MGLPINIFAIVYTAYMSVFMVFPSYLPIDASNMNVSIFPWAAFLPMKSG